MYKIQRAVICTRTLSLNNTVIQENICKNTKRSNQYATRHRIDLLEKLLVPKLVNYPAFNETRNFITLFTNDLCAS
jgi:hypothetical protein